MKCLRSVVLVLGSIASGLAGAIEVHQATPIEVAPSPPPPKSARAAQPKVVQASEPRIVRASEPKIVRASEPKIVQASEPKIVQAPEPKIVSAPGRREDASRAEAQDPSAIPQALFGRRWQLRVPGAAWQTENRVEGTRTLHVAPGSGRLPHEVSISPDGRYVWTANGKKISGTWAANVKSGYALTLLKAYEGKDWHATINNGELLLWDGNSLAGQFRGR